MTDLPFGIDRPTSDRVEVLVGKRPDRWDILQLAALSYELGACGLEVPGFVPGPALKQCQAMRKRVKAFANTGSCSAASAQLCPPSAETITLAIRPVPEYATPEIW